ncbi:hypothetical protein [Nocardioides soli]|uniref:Uncharacterized protein n=1 Tax=Nocardioides soli TaxID=1036020 RepID=A0A7W4VTB4_9ACTN|nr:hypothetical protein [Nocardioides soli]MBB3040994.1 hypothetical protein [Nocardioides soli]
MSRPRNHRLIHLADLNERHHGRMVEVAGITGTLTDVIAVGARVQLALVVGGARMWTDWIDANETAEVWKESAMTASECRSCGRPWDPDLEPSPGGPTRCEDCANDVAREE